VGSHGETLVLDKNARPGCCFLGKACFQRLEIRTWRYPLDRSRHRSSFRPVQAGNRKDMRLEQLIGVGQSPTRHQRHGTAQFRGKPGQILGQIVRHDDTIRRIRDVDQRAVDIEENRPFGGLVQHFLENAGTIRCVRFRVINHAASFRL